MFSDFQNKISQLFNLRLRKVTTKGLTIHDIFKLSTSNRHSVRCSSLHKITALQIRLHIFNMATPSAQSPDMSQLTEAMQKLDKTPSTTHTTIQDIKNDPCLWYKIHVFAYDLRNFREIPASQKRLNGIVHVSYIGLPYFEPEESQRLRLCLVEGDKTLEIVIEETLNKKLGRRDKKRVESGDFCVCTAHDLAPIFEKIFDIKPKGLAKDKAFLSILRKSG